MELETIKTFVAKFIRTLCHLFYIFEIDKTKIIFYPSNGKYYCNLKYITEFMLLTPNKYNFYWISNKDIFSEQHIDIKRIKKNSLMFFFHWLTAKIIIFNDAYPSYMLKRNGQIYIETWHGGGAYKKIGNSLKKETDNTQRLKRINYIFSNIDYVVSACREFTIAFKKDTNVKNAEFLNIGMPRNDIFFYNDNLEFLKSKIYKTLKLNNFTKIILYAPTFRESKYNCYLNVNNLLHAIRDKFSGECCMLLKGHPHRKDMIVFENFSDHKVFDVTNYPDMQELLCAADILITDYSSCMWDFSLMYKPCFIYATDIDQYKQERDFYTPMSEWPFPIATNTDELINNILNFNQEEYVEKVKRHHRALGSFEDGHACERACKLIEDIIDGKVQK